MNEYFIKKNKNILWNSLGLLFASIILCLIIPYIVCFLKKRQNMLNDLKMRNEKYL